MVAQIYIHGTDGPCIFNYTAFKLTYIFKLPLGITFLLVVGRRVKERAQIDTAAVRMGQLSMFTQGVSTICVAEGHDTVGYYSNIAHLKLISRSYRDSIGVLNRTC